MSDEMTEQDIDVSDIVRMTRDPEMYPEPHAAWVHILEVDNWAAGGWLPVDEDEVEDKLSSNSDLFVDQLAGLVAGAAGAIDEEELSLKDNPGEESLDADENKGMDAGSTTGDPVVGEAEEKPGKKVK
jgi:hypothetical protein